ncbi:MAG: ferrous iron transport protein B [Clostridia bacterium]|nr:ferrous iron transport protein B [Clostridia bacterium]
MKIALVGNQNSGKTTLFNLLTGTNQKIGNWPGVTIERKVGRIKDLGDDLVDLPGIYSLSPYTIEEEISRNFVLDGKPDLIINIVDATSIERSLYLTTQLMELDTKVIIALNMADRLEAKGICIDTEKLSKEIGTDVVKISALKETGIEELKSIIRRNKNAQVKSKEIFKSSLENEILKVRNELKVNRFMAIKILENDKLYQKYQIAIVKNSRQKLEETYKMDIEEIIANLRYDYIVEIKNKSAKMKSVKESMSDKLDKIFLNKFIAFPIFIAIMFLVYYLSVGVVGSFTVDWVAGIVENFGLLVEQGLTNLGASNWSTSLVVDGIIAGVGAVLGFVPQLTILFLCISILETTGYMSRVTFLLDKLFKKFGLSGETLVPFIVGLGCSVPAIMSTRIIKDNKERDLSIMLTPFIPCSAKLPIIAMFTGYFFADNSGLVSASLYFFAIAIILLSAIIIKKLFMKNSGTAFISELPEYKLPSVKYVARDVFDKVKEFIKRAGTIILFCSVTIWFLLSFSWKLEYGIEVEDSILASIGNTISWIFYPMLGTFSWEAAVSAIQGLVAKEQVISSMSIIAGFAEEIEEGSMLFKSAAFKFFTPISAYAFMVFNLFSAPCFGAIGAMKRELGSTKKMLKAIAFQTALAWILASLVFNVGTFMSSF